MPQMLEEEAHRLLCDHLQLIGFSPYKLLSFVRHMDSCQQMINVGGRRERSEWLSTCTLAIRFDAIETILRPDDKDVFCPTVSCPIHLLYSSREFFEWTSDCVAQLTVSVESLMGSIHEVGLRFLDEFSSVDSVERELLHSAVSDRLILTSYQRTGILASIAILRGQREVAGNLIAEALDDPKNQPAGRRRRIEALKVRLFT